MNANNEFCDQIQFLNDILNIADQEISNILIYFILKHFFDPLRIQTLSDYPIVVFNLFIESVQKHAIYCRIYFFSNVTISQ